MNCVQIARAKKNSEMLYDQYKKVFDEYINSTVSLVLRLLLVSVRLLACINNQFCPNTEGQEYRHY